MFSKSIKIFDVSRPIAEDEPIYPGNQPVVLTRIKDFKRSGSNLSGISLGLHTASHVDGPLHYLKNGRAIDQIPLGRFIGWSRLITAEKIEKEIGESEIRKINPKNGEIILFKTRNSWQSKSKRFRKDFVHLNESGAKILIKAKIKAVGIDGPSIRKFGLRPDTVHPALLRAGIIIYEGLNFKGVKPGRYFFIGLPLKIKNGEASPIRAILIK